MAMTLITIKASTDHRARNLLRNSKGFLPDKEYPTFFPVAIIIFFIAIPCTFAQSGQGITSQ